MTVAFFHGLESPSKSEKNDALHLMYSNVYEPAMNYREEGTFEKTLKEIKRIKPDLLIGSSMGGWWAYCLSTHTGIPTLLFNPAVHSRPYDPKVPVGNLKAKHIIVLGTHDDVINPSSTVKWLRDKKIKATINYENIGHRIPIDIFSKWIKIPMNENESNTYIMRNLPTYEDFLFEGGWATTKTQGTVITPDVIKRVVDIMQRIATEFNGHLKELELPSLDFLKPIGSGTWWEEDMKNQPTKTYGDVDFMAAYPTLKLTSGSNREDEIATVKMYNQELMMWLEAESPKGVDIESTKEVSTDTSAKIIAEVEMPNGQPGFVQVDLVVTHKEYQDWAVFRMTPIRNVKGFVLGNLYSSFGEVLELSIQPRGVRAKFEGGVMKPYSKRANVEDRVISANATTFMEDIARFFWEQSGTDKSFNNLHISKWKGISPKSPSFEDLCEGIRLVAETLAELGEFGTVIKYKSAQELLNAVAAQYEKKMLTTKNSSKFDKAQSPAAIAAMKKIQSTVDEYIQKANTLLK